MNNVTDKTNGLVRAWISAKTRLSKAKREVNSAECELANAQNALGKWLVPDNPSNAEEFNIWFGSGVLKASKQGNGSDYSVVWRKEPDDAKERAEFGI